MKIVAVVAFLQLDYPLALLRNDHYRKIIERTFDRHSKKKKKHCSVTVARIPVGKRFIQIEECVSHISVSRMMRLSKREGIRVRTDEPSEKREKSRRQNRTIVTFTLGQLRSIVTDKLSLDSHIWWTRGPRIEGEKRSHPWHMPQFFQLSFFIKFFHDNELSLLFRVFFRSLVYPFVSIAKIYSIKKETFRPEIARR